MITLVPCFICDSLINTWIHLPHQQWPAGLSGAGSHREVWDTASAFRRLIVSCERQRVRWKKITQCSIYLLTKERCEKWFLSIFLQNEILKKFFVTSVQTYRKVARILQRISVYHLLTVPKNVNILLHLLYTSLSLSPSLSIHTQLTHICILFLWNPWAQVTDVMPLSPYILHRVFTKNRCLFSDIMTIHLPKSWYKYWYSNII